MPSIKSITLVGLLAAAARVSAHGFVRGVNVDGTYHTGYLVSQFPYSSSPPSVIGWSTTATDLGFVEPSKFGTGDIVCHLGAKNAQLSAKVAAGGTVRMDWNTWPDSHKGPVIDYLAKCNGDCATVDKTALSFFKIAEKGLEAGKWASDTLMANNNSWAITIPTTIAAGNYVLRHEIIALHSAGNANGAQSYPQCINLEVTGGGSDAPAGTLGTALYKETDPGILVNIYANDLKYVIPGPAVFNGGSGSGTPATSAAPVATSTAAGVVTSAPVATSTAAGVVTSAPSATSAVPTTLVTAIKPSTSAKAPAPVATNPPVPEEEHDSCV